MCYKRATAYYSATKSNEVLSRAETVQRERQEPTPVMPAGASASLMLVIHLCLKDSLSARWPPWTTVQQAAHTFRAGGILRMPLLIAAVRGRDPFKKKKGTQF